MLHALRRVFHSIIKYYYYRAYHTGCDQTFRLIGLNMRCDDIIMCKNVLSFAGDTVLHAQMAVETLGRRKDPGAHDGPGRGHLYGRREKTEEKDSARLPVGKSTVPQLVDVQILSVRNDGAV